MCDVRFEGADRYKSRVLNRFQSTTAAIAFRVTLGMLSLQFQEELRESHSFRSKSWVFVTKFPVHIAITEPTPTADHELLQNALRSNFNYFPYKNFTSLCILRRVFSIWLVNPFFSESSREKNILGPAQTLCFGFPSTLDALLQEKESRNPRDKQTDVFPVDYFSRENVWNL